jgi:hypothetical protein
MWREFPDHPAVNLQKRCEISRFWSGFLSGTLRESSNEIERELLSCSKIGVKIFARIFERIVHISPIQAFTSNIRAIYHRLYLPQLSATSATYPP